MINFHYFEVIYSLLIGNGGHSAVLRTLPLSGSLNRWICGFAFGFRPNHRYARTSHIRQTLGEMLCIMERI